MKRYVLSALAIGAAVLVMSPSANARMTKSQIKAALEKTYPVRVLDKFTKKVNWNGKAAYEVKVMNRGGDSDAAFMVTTLVVDADTGKLLRVFRHKPSGYVLSDSGRHETNRQFPDSLRRFTWR